MEIGEPAGDIDEGNSFCLKVSRFPDDVEGLRFVVSVLPGVGGRPVKGKFNYNILAAKMNGLKTMFLMTKRVQASSRLLASLSIYGRGYSLMSFSTSDPNDKAEEGGKSQFDQIKQR